ncbi:hypothetical protein [uncultured Desulfobacter sp.]|uniref:hypothetical protein n=1 Tax=uncultured Desulfobacter sp. TaxID=240139 RepID=UPI0029F53E3B|nr:hypothetical protein [uncultured Desulfobacter sp.]
MTFNEMNTIENGLREHLYGRQKDEGGRINEVRENFLPYGSSFHLPKNADYGNVNNIRKLKYGY